MRKTMRRVVQVGMGWLVVGGILAVMAAPAAAHVTVTPSVTSAGSYTVLTFSVPHGCDGAPTTKIAIKIPEGINAVTPTVNPGWTVEKVLADLNPPVKDSHGNEITKRVDQILYTAKTPLPGDIRDTLELSLQLPKKPGETLAFPTVQTCAPGETAWAQVAAEGAEEPEHPAPAFKLTKSAGDGHSDEATKEPELAETSNTNGGSTGAVSWIALVIAALGLIAGGFALVRTRKSS